MQTNRASSTVARVVTLHTTVGELSIELYDAFAPTLCQNFYNLALHGRYNGTLFHRLIPGQLLQGGDTNGRGGEAFDGAFLDDELDPRLRHTGAGIVSSASAGPDMNGSQFMIALCPQPKLDNKYSIIGRVSYGMKLLETISGWEADPVTQKPYQTIKITHCSCGTYPQQRRPALLKVTTHATSGAASSQEAAVPNRKRAREVVDASEIPSTCALQQRDQRRRRGASSAVELLLGLRVGEAAV